AAGTRYQQNLEGQAKLSLQQAPRLAEAGRTALQTAQQNTAAASAGEIRKGLEAVLEQVGTFGRPAISPLVDTETGIFSPLSRAESGLEPSETIYTPRKAPGDRRSREQVMLDEALRIIETRLATARERGEFDLAENVKYREALEGYRADLLKEKERAQTVARLPPPPAKVGEAQAVKLPPTPATPAPARQLFRMASPRPQKPNVQAAQAIGKVRTPMLPPEAPPASEVQTPAGREFRTPASTGTAAKEPRDKLQKQADAAFEASARLKQQAVNDGKQVGELRAQITARRANGDESTARAETPGSSSGKRGKTRTRGKSEAARPQDQESLGKLQALLEATERRQNEHAEAARKEAERHTQLLAQIAASVAAPQVTIKNAGDAARASRRASPPAPVIGG
ncbi:MAG: hypothetical protein ACREHD_28605, partial [Pirellulales bacterium]